MLFQAVIGACFEPLEDLCVCPLSLAVAPGMSHRHKAELGADALAILLEEPTFELGPVVGLSKGPLDAGTSCSYGR
jgi:hypothetical protein